MIDIVLIKHILSTSVIWFCSIVGIVKATCIDQKANGCVQFAE